MTKRFYLTVTLASLLFAASIGFTAIYSSASVTVSSTSTTSKHPRSSFDKFKTPEETARLQEGATGKTGVTNSLHGPAANLPAHVPPIPAYAGGSAVTLLTPKASAPVPPYMTQPLKLG